MAGPAPATGRSTTTRGPRRRSAAARAPAAAPTVPVAPAVAPAAAPAIPGTSVMIPATVVATPAAPVVHAPREYMAVVYGLIVVVAGFVAILIALWLIVINANTSNTSSNAKGLSDPAAFMGMVAIAIAGLGGAFFGVALGLQGVVNANKERAAAEAAKDVVQLRAERYLAYLEPEIAKSLFK